MGKCKMVIAVLLLVFISGCAGNPDIKSRTAHGDINETDRGDKREADPDVSDRESTAEGETGDGQAKRGESGKGDKGKGGIAAAIEAVAAEFTKKDKEEDGEESEESETDAEEVEASEDDKESAARFQFDDRTDLNIGDFETTDLFGKAVDRSIFEDKDVTMINIWGTYCSPCIAEMPEIEELSESLPDNAAVIGLVSDVYEGIDPGTAIDITEDAGVEYSNLVIDEGLAEFLYEMGMQYVPTTVFVDSEGYVLGEPVIGVDPDSYKSRFESYGISFE